MALSRTGIFDVMSNQSPLQSKNQQAGMDAANIAAMRTSVASSSAPLSKPQVQSAGAAAVATAGQQRLANAQQNAQTQAGLATAKLGAQAADKANELGSRRLALQTKQRQIENNLESLGAEVKEKLFTANMNFNKDELGRTAWNERQLADWVVTKAKSAEDLRNYQAKVTMQSKRKMQILKAAHAQIMQKIEQDARGGIEAMDEASKERMFRAKASLEDKMRDEANRAKNKAAIGTAIGTLGGGALGAFTGTPQGAAAGAQIGGSLGGMASSVSPEIKGPSW